MDPVSPTGAASSIRAARQAGPVGADRAEPGRPEGTRVCSNICRQTRDNGVQGLHRKWNISLIKSALFLLSKHSPGAAASSNKLLLFHNVEQPSGF